MFMNNFISHLTFARCSPIHPVTQSHIEAFVYPSIHSFIHSLTLPSVTRCLCQSTRLNWPDAPSRANSCLKCCFHLLLLLRVGVAYVNTLNTFDFVYVECSAMFKWAGRGGAEQSKEWLSQSQWKFKLKLKLESEFKSKRNGLTLRISNVAQLRSSSEAEAQL